jgi:uncharacterized protein (UPF0333 family)
MVMLALSLIIFAAIITFSMTMLSGVRSQIATDSAYKAVAEIKESADFIYVHGHPSKIRRNVRIPSNVENITLNGSLIKITVSTGQSFTDIYDITKGNITAADAMSYLCRAGVCREGNYLLNVESLDSTTGYNVNISAA